MKRVTGIDGIFFKADNPAKLYEWYKKTPGDQIGAGCRKVIGQTIRKLRQRSISLRSNWRILLESTGSDPAN